MRRRLACVAAVTTLLIAAAAVVADAHDLFLRPRDFVVRAGRAVQVRVLNGTFSSSESVVARARLRDLTVAGPGGVTHPARTTWTSGRKESGWRVAVGGAGTTVLGASLEPSTIRLNPTQFNGYLRDEGLPDILAARTSGGELSSAAHERYAKHVKALVLVRDAAGTLAAGADTVFRVALGYPAELVPLDDPYRLPAGGTLRLRVMVDGEAMPNQVVQAGGRTTSGSRIPQRETRTDAEGIATVRLDTRGTWYVKFIHMRVVPASAGDSVTHESRWATLTFARP